MRPAAWLVDGSLSHIPPEWRFLAAFLTARGFLLMFLGIHGLSELAGKVW